MLYGHIYTIIVSVHSIKDCLDQPLHRSYVISWTTLLLPSEWGNQSMVNLDCKKCLINIKYDIVVIPNPLSYNLMCTIEL